MTKSRAYAADQLFATLDTTTRNLFIEGAPRTISLSDTVGFIRDLPHRLVEAFEATLQEAADADLLLHVVDAASPQRDEQIAEVERVLREIGAENVPQVLVFNKTDLLDANQRPREITDLIEGEGGVRTPRVFVSARSGEGLAPLRQLIAQAMTPDATDPSLKPARPAPSAGLGEPGSPVTDNQQADVLPTHA